MPRALMICLKSLTGSVLALLMRSAVVLVVVPLPPLRLAIDCTRPMNSSLRLVRMLEMRLRLSFSSWICRVSKCDCIVILLSSVIVDMEAARVAPAYSPPPFTEALSAAAAADVD